MIELTADASDEEILALVRRWAGLLAAEDYAGAHALTRHGPGDAWTPELMQRVISSYGPAAPPDDECTHRVTPLDSATGGPAPRHEVTRFEGSGDLVGAVWFDLPLDGAWSDLTATFEIRLEDEHRLVLVLEDLHVM